MARKQVSSVVVRDKFYFELDNGWLFNVTGYEHPAEHAFASLKYVDGKKWTDGYQAAWDWLRKVQPDLVQGDYICVPTARVSKIFDPQERMFALFRQHNLSGVLLEAVQLAKVLSNALGLSDTADERSLALGITDSLLWGDGHENSDIDLVVVGRPNIARLVRRLPLLYKDPAFQRPDPMQMAAPYGSKVNEWPRILSRKWHMGQFEGRLFSVRGMLSDDECRVLTQATADRQRNTLVEFEVADVSDALLFPATYRDAQGDELVDYSVVYEGVFRCGDVVACPCVEETSGTRRRYVINGAVEF